MNSNFTSAIRLYSCALLLMLASCSNTQFGSGGNKPSTKRDNNVVSATPPPAVTGNILGHFVLNSGSKSLKLTGAFAPKSGPAPANGNYHMDYDLTGSLVAESNTGFPDTLVQQITASKATASIDYDAAEAGTYTAKFNIQTHGIVSSGATLPDQTVTLTQTNSAKSWTKDEGPVNAFGDFGETTASPSNCAIELSGEQPHSGVYAVILTKPAPCDFKLPQVKVGSGAQRTVEIPIGTYWNRSSTPQTAHPFPTTAVAPQYASTTSIPGSAVSLDNGFILVGPDNKSYLLVDGGSARPTAANYHSAEVTAKALSQSLGLGDTSLLQPSPGSSADNFASTTLFKKGSIIAIYDDTPDMSGFIDVNSLIASATTNGGMTLQWDAAEVK